MEDLFVVDLWYTNIYELYESKLDLIGLARILEILKDRKD